LLGKSSASRVHGEHGTRTHARGERIFSLLDGEGRAGSALEEFSILPGDVIAVAPATATRMAPLLARQ
jgi:hypothetical protein